MQYELEFAKWKWFGTKDIDLWIVYIWVNWGLRLTNLIWYTWDLKIKCWEEEYTCFLWDSTQPIRYSNQDNMLIQLSVNISPQEMGKLAINNLYLITE